MNTDYVLHNTWTHTLADPGGEAGGHTPPVSFLPSFFLPSLSLPVCSARGSGERCKLPERENPFWLPKTHLVTTDVVFLLLIIIIIIIIIAFLSRLRSWLQMLMIFLAKRKRTAKHPILAWYVLWIAQCPSTRAKFFAGCWGRGMGKIKSYWQTVWRGMAWFPNLDPPLDTQQSEMEYLKLSVKNKDKASRPVIFDLSANSFLCIMHESVLEYYAETISRRGEVPLSEASWQIRQRTD